MLSYPDGSNDDIVVAMTQLIYNVERGKHQYEVEERQDSKPLTYGRSLELDDPAGRDLEAVRLIRDEIDARVTDLVERVLSRRGPSGETQD